MSDSQFPHGKKYPDDEGELSVRLAADPDSGVVRFDFMKPVQWIALEKEEAIAFANLILEKAKQL